MDKIKLPDVTLVGITGTELEGLAVAAEICRSGIDFGAVKLITDLPAEGHENIVPIEEKLDYPGFKHFVIDKLNDFVDTEFVLRFEPDGFILNPQGWSDDFLRFDYIGAAWDHRPEGRTVGNGGFSLRSKRLMALVQEHHREIGGAIESEDQWICIWRRQFLEEHGMIFAPEEIARRFSIEGGSWKGQFGFHDLRRTDISAWLKDHPDYYKNIKGREIRGGASIRKKSPKKKHARQWKERFAARTNSGSWRITAPLRRVLSALKKSK